MLPHTLLALALTAQSQSAASLAPLSLPSADEGRCVTHTGSGRGDALRLYTVAWEVHGPRYGARRVTITTDIEGRLVTYNESSSTLESINNPVLVSVIAGTGRDGQLTGVRMRMSRADSARVRRARERLGSLGEGANAGSTRSRKPIDRSDVSKLTSGLWMPLDSSEIHKVGAVASAVRKKCGRA